MIFDRYLGEFNTVTFLRSFVVLFCFLSVATLSGCAELELGSHFGKKVAGSDAVSKGSYKVGKPYVIEGKKYYPEVNYQYSESGIASWYGPGFHGKRTANGERFDTGELTAAHRTLPMPSIVRVTNLENGKSLVVRVNDRGPYSRGRIIDVSQKAAELLGFKMRGVAKVRVDVLEQESRKIAALAMQGGDTRGFEVAMNKPGYKAASYKPPAGGAEPMGSPTLKTAFKQDVTGHLKNGLFYPDPVVSKEPVKESRIYVQVGAFASEDNARHLAENLKKIGDAKVYPAVVNGKNYHRVRIFAPDVASADIMFKRVVQSGHKNALIVVD